MLIKKSHRQKLLKNIHYPVGILLLVTCILLCNSSAKAETAISQGYQTTSSNISAGSLVCVTNSGGKDAAPANTQDANCLIGVTGNKPLVALSNGGKNNLQVILGGTANALVSNINGDVKTGDKITASPLDGVGMKATSSVEIVGTAQANLKSVKTVNEIITKKDGSKSTVKVGLIPVEVGVAYYSVPASKAQSSQYLPPFLQNIANTISGKQVSPWRVLIGFVALLLGFAASMVMLYASVRSNMISIGRNPLARGALRKGFFDVALFAIGVLVITFVATFIILSI